MKSVLTLLFFAVSLHLGASTCYIQNVYGREHQSLNGKWAVIIDPYEAGVHARIYMNRRPSNDTEFYEYSFDNAHRLNVPGDWNSQQAELKYYEGTVWYGRHFLVAPDASKRRFLYFAGVSQRCKVYLNGQLVGSHEGSFTPFQIEVSDRLREGDNFVVVEVSNRRQKDAIPALSFDWWNYGGITRDVMLVTLPKVYVSDYFVQLDKRRPDLIHAWVSLSDSVAGERITVSLPELGKTLTLKTGADGTAHGDIHVPGIRRWAPDAPYLYDVVLTSAADRVVERIGFRNIVTQGTKILVNGKETFLRGVSFHEEIPQRMGRAYSPSDARQLLGEAKALGVNMVRLAHYQQNEYIVRQAEEMGVMVWQEIPVWQAIDFENPQTLEKAKQMLLETMGRDKNRCADCFWGIANETADTPARNRFLSQLLQAGKSADTTRLFVAAFDIAYFRPEQDCFTMDDHFYQNLDMVGINKYMGWYAPWPKIPAEIRWDVAPGKPLFISEFGGEALYGQHGDAHVASSWSEEYQAKLYRDNLAMFENIPNLCGVSPWVLYDFRSPTRFHPTHQEGWNRKGLLSDQGLRKQAWYIMHDYYARIRRAK